MAGWSAEWMGEEQSGAKECMRRLESSGSEKKGESCIELVVEREFCVRMDSWKGKEKFTGNNSNVAVISHAHDAKKPGGSTMAREMDMTSSFILKRNNARTVYTCIYMYISYQIEMRLIR